MKILIVLIKWPGGVGGGVKNIMNELKLLGHEVDVISRNEYFKTDSLVRSFFRTRNEIRRLVKEKKYDIIYTQDWSIALPLIFPYPIYRKKHFCMFHGNSCGLISRGMQNLVAIVLHKHLCCMAPSLKRRFPLANINYCGVNLNKFKNLKKKRKYLGWIQKGTEKLTKEEVETISKKINIPLLTAKGLKHEEMNEKFYSHCKVFISFPPKEAGFQASWLEAMAAGVPIILGNNEGAGEIQPFDKIENEYDLDSIVQKIKNPKKLDYQKWIKKEDFTWKRHAKKLIEIFNKK